MAKAGPLLCGGTTVFAPFLIHDVASTARVGVIGIGGLGHVALQFPMSKLNDALERLCSGKARYRIVLINDIGKSRVATESRPQEEPQGTLAAV